MYYLIREHEIGEGEDCQPLPWQGGEPEAPLNRETAARLAARYFKAARARGVQCIGMQVFTYLRKTLDVPCEMRMFVCRVTE